MDPEKRHSASRAVWRLTAEQHGVVSRGQLLGLGYDDDAIRHRIASGRLHPVRRGVYAVGRDELSRHGVWMAAVLACGEGAVLSHSSAAELWGIGREGREIEVSVSSAAHLVGPDLRVHRRRVLGAEDRTEVDGIPVTAVARTLVDLAARQGPDEIERSVNEADRAGLIDPEALRADLRRFRGQRGVARLRAILDAGVYRLTESALERRFLAIVRSTALGLPPTQVEMVGGRADFHFPELGLVVETDGLRYHRTPATQSADARRDQERAARGLTTLRFTHWQVRHEPERVRRTLIEVAELRRAARRAGKLGR